MQNLPIDVLLPELRTVLAQSHTAVIEAPPGAGKTTRAPLALLDAAWLAGRKLVVLEPRRLAARAAAQFMARTLGEPVGKTIGYRVRMETRVSARTRIEIVTEGVLLRLLQADPALADYGLVIFDEFHERSLSADLALTLCLDMQAVLRPDLRLLVMSATLDGAAVAKFLGDAPRLRATGRSFPVTTHYRALDSHASLEPQVIRVLDQVLAGEPGGVLVFLPGTREIRRVAAGLTERVPPGTQLRLLYGDLGLEEQDAAILPAPAGQRKLVLATSIAETSLTIEDVRVVVDAGLARVPRFDPVSGLTRLVTQRVSQASADQRRGRAGRLAPGVCYRLWGEAERLEVRTAPAILHADLAPLVLELAAWGSVDPQKLHWLDPPPTGAVAQAAALLQQLGALDVVRRITAHGKALLQLPLHPRLAHMVVKGAERGTGSSACLLAALLSERELLPREARRQTDVAPRLEALAQAGGTPKRPSVGRLRRLWAVAQDIARAAAVDTGRGCSPEHAGLLLALAYPDRVARRRPGGAPRYLLSNGRGAFLEADDALAGSDWLAVAALDGNPREARIFLAAHLEESVLRQVLADQIIWRERTEWDVNASAVSAVREQCLGAIVLESGMLANPDPERSVQLLLAAIRRAGVGCLPWTAALRNWQARVLLLRGLQGERWPDISDEHLAATLEVWLAPHLAGVARLRQLSALPLQVVLESPLDYRQRQKLDELAPEHFRVPTGAQIRLDYTAGATPVLAVRVQELFGLDVTPCIVNGRVPLLLHLLSPAGRPLQVTRDLPGFWRASYAEIVKEMRGRYPKHPWPDDPLHAQPTRHTKRRRGK
ncbi:MAG: ATP-dependent helicase HrpB [Gammaproteobacteria bacterium]